MPNLGPASARMLADAGIASVATLRRLGAVEAWRRVRARHPRASLNLLWALEGALTGRDWQRVARTERTRLLLAVDAATGSPRVSAASPIRTSRSPRPMYTLYGIEGSGSAAVEAALELAGARWTLVRTASWDPGADFDKLLALNPTGLVPTLALPDGSVLTETAAILIHLADTHPGSRLLPVEPGARAQAIRGLVFITAHCYAAIGIIDYPERWCTDCDAASAERIRQSARKRLHRSWEIFADTFPATPWLGGADLGALDLFAAVVSKWSGARPHLAKARPAFHERLVAIERHPRIAPVFDRHWPPTA